MPPNSIVLDDLLVFIDEVSEGNQQLFAEKVKLDFSITKFLSEKKFSPRRISLDKLQLDYTEYIFSPEEFIKQIREFFGSLEKGQTYSLLIKDGLFALPPHAGTAGYMVADVDLDFQPNRFISFKGAIGLTSSAVRDQSWSKNLNYNFRATLKRGGINIEKAEFQRGDLYLKLWGTSHKDLLRLNGNLLSIKSDETTVRKAFLFKIPKSLKEKIKRFCPDFDKAIPEYFRPAKTGLNIFNLGCLIKISPSELQIKNLNFSLGNVPFSLKGKIPIFKPGEVSLKFSSFANLPENLRLKNLRSFDLNIIGQLEELRFNGKADFKFLRKADTELLSQEIALELKNLDFDFAAYQRIKTYFDQAEFSCTIEDKLCEILFTNFT